MVISAEVQAQASKVTDLARICGMLKRHGYDDEAMAVFKAWQAEDRKLKAMCQ